MYRLDRLIPVAVILSAGLALSACSGTSSNFDPTDWITGEFFSNKTPLPGERKPVFPEGVPGVAQGVPKELVKGNQQQQAAIEEAAAPAAEPAPAARPAPKPQAKPAARPRTASAPPRPAPARATPAQQPQPQPASPPASQPAVAWPDPSPASPSVPQANWPPPDSGSFSR